MDDSQIVNYINKLHRAFYRKYSVQSEEFKEFEKFYSWVVSIIGNNKK